MARARPIVLRVSPAFFALLSLLALAFPPPAPAEDAGSAPVAPPAPLDLAWCLERAARANPEIAAEAAGAEAARQRIVPAGALDDPRFSYQASNLPTGELDFDSTMMSGHQLGLSQKLPFPGVLGNRRKAARAGADAAEASLADRRRRVAARVEQAWAQLGFSQRAVEITDSNIELLRQLTRVAEAKYRVGTGRQQDVLRAQVALTRLLDQRLERRAALDRREAELLALLDLPPGTAFPRTTDLGDDAAPPDADALLAGLEQSSPLLLAQRERIDEAQRLARAAELEGYPDLDLGLGYRVRERVAGDPVEGQDFLSAGVTLRLPVDRRRWSAHAAAQHALLRRARAEYRVALARLREMVLARLADLRRADAEIALLETGLVPQSRQSLESSRSGYEVDKVDFLSLIDSQVALLDAELRLVRARASRRVAFAALEAAVGEPQR
jgi:cobalt-zinc-cadmium efflux system outer membrane protein